MTDALGETAVASFERVVGLQLPAPIARAVSKITALGAEFLRAVYGKLITLADDVDPTETEFHHVLMDTRMSAALSEIQALSIEGVAFTVADADKQASDRTVILDRFIQRHPDVEEFVRHPDAAVICVEVHEFLLLNGIRDAHRVKVTP